MESDDQQAEAIEPRVMEARGVAEGHAEAHGPFTIIVEGVGHAVGSAFDVLQNLKTAPHE